MNKKQQKTLEAIFQTPIRTDIRWVEIVSLLKALDAEFSEGRGSRMRVVLRDRPAVFHRPHPKPVTDRGTVRSLRRLLENAGIRP